MLEEAILEAKAGGARARGREAFSPQITVDAPILIPEDYVPDLDLRMGLYRRMNELESAAGDRGLRRRDDRPLRHAARGDREPAQDHRDQAQLPQQAHGRQARRRPEGRAGHTSTTTASPTSPGLLAYVERLKGTAKLRPDSKLVITRAWPTRRGAAQRRAAAVEGAGAESWDTLSTCARIVNRASSLPDARPGRTVQPAGCADPTAAICFSEVRVGSRSSDPGGSMPTPSFFSRFVVRAC